MTATYRRESFFFLLIVGTAPWYPFTGKRVLYLSWILRTLDQASCPEPVEESALDVRVGVNQFVDEDISSLEQQRFGWKIHQRHKIRVSLAVTTERALVSAKVWELDRD